jgi:predicted esterase
MAPSMALLALVAALAGCAGASSSMPPATTVGSSATTVGSRATTVGSLPPATTVGSRATTVGSSATTVGSLQPLAGSDPAAFPLSSAGAPPLVASPRSPLGGEPFVDLPVEGHRAAVVSLPLGATSPRPLLVVTHGAGGRPEPHCAFWRALLGSRGFILCPRGSLLGSLAEPQDQGFFYRDHHALEREVTAAMAALRARFGELVDDRAPMYAGFSQGATMGALAFVKRPAVFARLVLIEGGSGESDEWTISGARAFRETGGARVLFACGRASCFLAAKKSVTYLDKAGVEGRVVHAAGAGHTYGGAVAEAVQGALAWITEGDARWSDR